MEKERIDDSWLSEEEEEVDRKRVKVFHISEMKESQKMDPSERYDVLSDIALNIAREKDMMVSDAMHQMREEVKRLQKNPSYRLLQKVMNQRGQEGDDLFTFIKYYKNNLSSPYC